MNLSLEAQVAIGFGVVVFAVLIFLSRSVYRRLPKRMKQLRNQQKWSELQKFCKKPETWPDAVIAADKLLDDILKRRRFKGKSMGERIVSAQRTLSDNDAVWFAHNLAKKTKEDDAPQLKEGDVKKALLGFRQALRDLGALQHGNK